MAATRPMGGMPTHLWKKIISDMDEFVTAGTSPIRSYGPGDFFLDHTPDEPLQPQAFQASIEILQRTSPTPTQP